MQIRESNESDKDRIRKVHQDAFGETEGEVVSQLGIDLLEDKTALPILSLVAEEGNDIVGHIIFSSVKIDGTRSPGAFILAPLGVASGFQGGGIGTDLIRQGLNILRERDAEFVLVLGDPKYYSRTGFTPDHGLKPPHELAYPEAWMAQELRPGALVTNRGTVQCAVSLNSPEHW
jgi:predicted N-acetyltransferase YhbS